MIYRTHLLIAALLASFASLSGCVAGTPPLASNPYESNQYLLAPADQLRITVFGEPALTKNYVITTAGDIAFPLLGDVPATGKSVGEFSEFLTGKLADGYLKDPRVNVEVLNFRPIYVLGEVSRSGEFKYKPELTALQAVALAGGFTYRADRRRVFIRRAGADAEFTYELDKGRAIYLRPGDTIRVGERYF